MPLDVEGWVETSWRADDDLPEEDNHWRGVIRVAPILFDATDAVGEALFGFSKRAISDHTSFPVVARDRGVPSHCSAEVRASLEAIARHEAQHGKGELGGYTHMTWREIKAVDWMALGIHEVARKDSEWSLLFEMMALLERRCRDDKIRVVAWWNW